MTNKNSNSDDELTDEQMGHFEDAPLSDADMAAVDQAKMKTFSDPKGGFIDSIPTFAGSMLKTLPFVEGEAHKLGFDDWLKKQALNERKYPVAAIGGKGVGYGAQYYANPFEAVLGPAGKGAEYVADKTTKWAPEIVNFLAKKGANALGRSAAMGGVTATDAAAKDQEALPAFEKGAALQLSMEGIGGVARGTRSLLTAGAKKAIDVPEEVYNMYSNPANRKAIDEASFGKTANKFLEARNSLNNNPLNDEDVNRAKDAADLIIPRGPNKDALPGKLRGIGMKPDEKITSKPALDNFDKFIGSNFGQDVKNATANEMLSGKLNMPGNKIPLSVSGVVKDGIKSAAMMLMGGNKKNAIKIINSLPAKYASRLIDAANSGSTAFAIEQKHLEDTDPEYQKLMNQPMGQ
jgi:hypothetical protein